MKVLRAGFIGTGKPRFQEGSTGFGMGYEHAMGYKACQGIELAACADLSPENGQAFAGHFKVPAVYTDYRRMLKKEKLDMVSICTWPHLHFPMVAACIRWGVKFIHCEKPMAVTWGDARKMAAMA